MLIRLSPFCAYQAPMSTVGQPNTSVPPWDVASPIRAAGSPPIKTEDDPLTMALGGPAHTHKSPSRAAGMPPIKTVGHPAGAMTPPTCGLGEANGQMCGSPTRAAKLIVPFVFPCLIPDRPFN